MTMTLRALLQELVSGQRRIIELLEQGNRALPCQPDQVLATIAASVGGRVFNAAELRRHALVDENLRRALGDLSSQQVGIKLRAWAGRDVGGLTVVRVGRDADGVMWAVSVTPELHAGAGIGADRGA